MWCYQTRSETRAQPHVRDQLHLVQQPQPDTECTILHHDTDPEPTQDLQTPAAHLALAPRGLALLASDPPSMRRSLTAMVPPASALARWYPPGSTCRELARL